MSKQTLKRILTLSLSAIMMICVLSGCATVGGEGESAGFSGSFYIVYILVIVAVFYFFMIRPEKKRRKESDDMRNNLSVGDTVTTIGGIVGKIVNINNDIITIETSEDRVRVQLAKWGVSTVGKKGDENPDE